MTVLDDIRSRRQRNRTETFGEGDRITVPATATNGLLDPYYGVILFTLPELDRVMTCVWTKERRHIHTESFGLYEFDRWDGVLPE